MSRATRANRVGSATRGGDKRAIGSLERCGDLPAALATDPDSRHNEGSKKSNGEFEEQHFPQAGKMIVVF
jgi:hypothetical protein